KLIVFNRERHEKVLRAARPGGEKPRILQCQDETDEARQVVADLQTRLRGPGVQPRDFAILFRTNEQPRTFEMELRRLNLPYVLVGGMSFYDRKEVRDILAYLKLLVAPHDEPALLRVINNPPRGIGQTTVTALLEQAVKAGKPLWDVMRRASDSLNPAAIAAIVKFQGMIARLQQRLGHESLVEVAV